MPSRMTAPPRMVSLRQGAAERASKVSGRLEKPCLSRVADSGAAMRGIGDGGQSDFFDNEERIAAQQPVSGLRGMSREVSCAGLVAPSGQHGLMDLRSINTIVIFSLSRVDRLSLRWLYKLIYRKITEYRMSVHLTVMNIYL